MSHLWTNRKTRLRVLLQSKGDEEEEGLALDRLLHGQNIIGKTPKTLEVDELRFQDKDLRLMGTLDHGQFGVIYVVTCTIDGRVYIRKTTNKFVATRYHEQCSPQLERDILLQARLSNSPWVPHLYCAYQTDTDLKLVMDYAEGGSLWDVMESSPLGGRISEDDLRWWTPQIVSAIHWCHSRGFAHRDVKPHNFVLTRDSRIQLVDFGTAAPLQPPDAEGVRVISPEHCTVPCGTCDYISPEILKAHERALVALELDEESQISRIIDDRDSYGLETDWWSLGAMLYEMIYGVAPFFAEDIKKTYVKITHHQSHLRFHDEIPLSAEYRDFLQRLLTDAEFRIGRYSITEIITHSVFTDVNWDDLSTKPAPQNLHLPQFTYATPDELPPQEASLRASGSEDLSVNKPFAFSGLFVSSPATASDHPATPQPETNSALNISTPSSRDKHFIGFSWGPEVNASISDAIKADENPYFSPTPTPLRIPSTRIMTPLNTPFPLGTPSLAGIQQGFQTPMRSYSDLHHLGATPYGTLPPGSAVKRTVTRRPVSDREAMKQLVDCVGMSARKRVLESGRKPKSLKPYPAYRAPSHRAIDDTPPLSSLGDSEAGQSTIKPSTKKTLRFMPPQPITTANLMPNQRHVVDTSLSDAESGLETSGDDISMPISPSPTPRPNSAMSMVSMMSKRSGTPTAMFTLTGTRTFSSGSLPSMPSDRINDVTTRRRSSDQNPSTSKSPPASLRGRSNSKSLKKEPPAADRSEALRERSQMLSPSLEEETLDNMETKHVYIMGDIADIEHRLHSLSNFMDRK